MTDTEDITIEEYASGTATPQLVASRVVTVPLPPEVIEQRQYSTNLAAELVSYKADRDAAIVAIDVAVAAIPNNAFTGASALKTALREIADEMRATRRMFRAGIRDVAALDDGS